MNARLQPAELAKLVVQGEIRGRDHPQGRGTGRCDRRCIAGGRDVAERGERGRKGRGFRGVPRRPSKLPEIPRPDPEAAAFVFYTSGTTGLPKGVVIAHRTSEHRIVWISTQAGLRHGTHNRTLGMVPISHAIGFYGTLLVTLAYNGTFYTMSAFNPVAANDLIERRRSAICFRCRRSTRPWSPPRTTNRKECRRSTSSCTAVRRSCRRCSIASIANGPRPCATSTAQPKSCVRSTTLEPVGRPVTLRPGYYSRVRIVSPGGNENDLVKPGEPGELIVDASADTFFSEYL